MCRHVKRAQCRKKRKVSHCAILRTVRPTPNGLVPCDGRAVAAVLVAALRCSARVFFLVIHGLVGAIDPLRYRGDAVVEGYDAK